MVNSMTNRAAAAPGPAFRVYPLPVPGFDPHQSSFLLVTHNLELARRCDRIIEVVDGRIQP
jgi:hypothetical protein